MAVRVKIAEFQVSSTAEGRLTDLETRLELSNVQRAEFEEKTSGLEQDLKEGIYNCYFGEHKLL